MYNLVAPESQNHDLVALESQISLVDSYLVVNRMAWQWAETLVEIRVTLADIRGTTK